MASPVIPDRLDAIVTANRFTIAVVFPVVGALLLIASGEGWLPPTLSFNAWIVLFGIAVMRLPLIAGILPVLGRRGMILLTLAVGYVYGIEYLGVMTGWPYGEFTYGVALGPMVGGIPAALPLFFLPLVLDAMILVTAATATRSTVLTRTVRMGLAVGLVILIDLVLDPGAVALGFWAYGAGGSYYGVPVSNYFGWALSAVVVVILLDVGLWGPTFRSRVASCPFILDDLVSFVLLWGTVNAYYANWIPTALAGAVAVALLRTGRLEIPTRRRWLRTIRTRVRGSNS